MIVAIVPLLVCVIGLVIYFATEGKPSAIGKSMFDFGLLVTLFCVGCHMGKVL